VRIGKKIRFSKYNFAAFRLCAKKKEKVKPQRTQRAQRERKGKREKGEIKRDKTPK